MWVYTCAPGRMHSVVDTCTPLLKATQFINRPACAQTSAGADRRTNASGKHTQLMQNCYRAHTLCTNKLFLTTASFAMVPFWLRAIEAWLGVLNRTQLLFHKPCSFLDYARSHVSIPPNQNDTMAVCLCAKLPQSCLKWPSLGLHNWPGGTQRHD